LACIAYLKYWGGGGKGVVEGANIKNCRANLILSSVIQTSTINWLETENEFNDFLENKRIKVSSCNPLWQNTTAIKSSRHKNCIKKLQDK
jgi:hypothetical protein